jgi:hypothetical protein
VLAAPGVAHAADATIAMRELPVGAQRSLSAVRSPGTFDLLGFHWIGFGAVSFRTRKVDGRWSGWTPADTDDNRRGQWHLGNPFWVGASDRVEYRLHGDVRRLRAYYVWSPIEKIPLRTVSIAGSPQIIPRAGWGALESIRRAPPRYAPAVRFAVVHHTAGTNSYGPAASAAIVRGIELYHVKGNGWNDIGYNFLVDRYGQVFEGRYGGITRNVIGAHAGGFNGGSTGVSVIGNFGTTAPPAAALTSLEKLIAWRLDVAHVDPLGTLTWLSGGNPRFASGSPVFLRAIAGHRDTGFTDCPGDALYRLLPQIAHAVAGIGLPKLYSPGYSGKLGGPIRFTGRLTTALPWTVTVTGPTGATVARGSGSGTAISWTWNSAGAPKGAYGWLIDAGPTVQPARGMIGAGGVPPPPPPPPTTTLLTGLTLTPPAFSPNGDGFADATTVSYTLSSVAAVTATVTNSSGAVAATLFSGQRQSARRISFTYAGDGLADGNYALNVDAKADDGREVRVSTAFVVDRTLSSVAASPNPLPAGQTLTITFALAKDAHVVVTVAQADRAIATVIDGQFGPGTQTVQWQSASTLAAGSYTLLVTAADDVATISQPLAFDVTAP